MAGTWTPTYDQVIPRCPLKETSFWFQDSLHQNEAKATEAIQEGQGPLWGKPLERQRLACHCIKEVETQCSTTITEAEAHCAADIREAESCCMDHAHSIQQLHADGMQHLETKAMEEEGRDCLSFLATCGVALQACPPEAHGVLMCPSNYSQGTCPWPLSWPFPPGIYHQGGIYPCDFPSNYSSSTQALLGDQTMTPFAWPGGILATVLETKLRDFWRAAPPEMERWDTF